MRLIIRLLAVAAIGAAADEPLLLQKPTLSKTHIVFAYAGDLWSVPREGGDAARLTSGTGIETDPAVLARRHAHRLHRRVRRQRGRLRRSRRGRRAEAAHVAPGGRSRPRLDSRRQAHHFRFLANGPYSRFGEMFTVPAEGGVEEKLPLPTGYEASMSADGQSIAYEPTGKAFTHVEAISRRPDRAHLDRASVRQHRHEGAAHEFQRLQPNVVRGPRLLPVGPQRAGDALLLRLESQEPYAKRSPIRAWTSSPPRLGPDAIVYEQFGGISHLRSEVRQDETRLRYGCRATCRNCVPGWSTLGGASASPAVSPTGARAVFTARGEIITVPAEKGDAAKSDQHARRHGARPAVVAGRQEHRVPLRRIGRVRAPHPSAERRRRSEEDRVEARVSTALRDILRTARRSPWWTASARLSYVDLETAKQVEVAQDTYQMRNGDIAGAWSPDSKWLAYSKVLPNELSAIHLYSLADAKSTQVTDGLSDAANPVFDKDGKYLYFTASTNSGEASALDIHAVGRTSRVPSTWRFWTRPQSSPFAPESDEEKAADDKKPPMTEA